MFVDSITTVKNQYYKPDSANVEAPDAVSKHSEPERNSEPEIKVSQDMLNEVQQKMQMMHNIGLSFSVHKATGQTVVTVVDKETEKLIREIPSEELLNLADKMGEMVGILFDKKV